MALAKVFNYWCINKACIQMCELHDVKAFEGYTNLQFEKILLNEFFYLKQGCFSQVLQS